MKDGKVHNAARRRFLGQVTLSVGGVALANFAQASLLVAPASCVQVAAGFSDPCGDWTLDDMCGAYPPYAFHTGSAVPHSRPADVLRGGADWHWVA